MSRFPHPTCPKCHGAGDIEHALVMPNGQTVGFEYHPCPCTFRAVWVDEEEWKSNDRH